MSTLETNLIQPSTGTTLTVGASGDTIAIPAGVNTEVNKPAFFAYKSGTQSLSHNTQTTLTYDSTDYNTDSFWDTSTNKATIPTGQDGKYFFYGCTMGTMGEAVTVWKQQINKNGSYVQQIYDNNGNSEYQGVSFTYSGDFSAGDYFEFSLLGQATDGGGTVTVLGASGQRYTYVGGYKLTGA